MELEHAFWSEKRSANYGFAQTISIAFRFETLISDSTLCYRFALNLLDDPTALFSCVLSVQECAKFTKQLAQFSKHLHQMIQSESSVLDLVQMPDEQLLMSTRAATISDITQHPLPWFSALFKRASVQEQLQHLRLHCDQQQAELIQERQLSQLLRTQNDHLMARLKQTEETSLLIRQAIETLIGKDPALLSKFESNAERVSTSSQNLPSTSQISTNEASTSGLNTSQTSVQLQESRDDLLLGIASYLLCAVCEKVSVPAANSTELNRHFIDAHVDEQKCLACPDANVFDLLSHMKTHTQKVYACEFCGKKGRKHYLKSHVRTHTGEKPFKCQTCGRKFADQSTIRRHQTTVHSMEKKFICPICGRDISRKDNYRVHLKSHSNSNSNLLNADKQADVNEEDESMSAQLEDSMDGQNIGEGPGLNEVGNEGGNEGSEVNE